MPQAPFPASLDPIFLLFSRIGEWVPHANAIGAIGGHRSYLDIQVLPHHCLKGGQGKPVTMEMRGTASYRPWMTGCFDQMVAVARPQQPML